MEDRYLNYHKVKKKYLKFLTSQEVMSEPFRDKLGQLNKFYLPISKMIAEDYLKKKKTKVIGLTGGQGTGKSTISNILKIILKEAYKLETVIFSIDDFYKTLSERKKISKKISPLFLTRGVPGTHDTKMLLNCINNLKNNNFKKMIIPKFDKSADDRCTKNKWAKVLQENSMRTWLSGPKQSRMKLTSTSRCIRRPTKNEKLTRSTHSVGIFIVNEENPIEKFTLRIITLSRIDLRVEL